MPNIYNLIEANTIKCGVYRRQSRLNFTYMGTIILPHNNLAKQNLTLQNTCGDLFQIYYPTHEEVDLLNLASNDTTDQEAVLVVVSDEKYNQFNKFFHFNGSNIKPLTITPP